MAGKAQRSVTSAEQQRLAEANSGKRAWRRWGPYLSERAWGTVREDYSADGDAWNYFPFDDARSRTYRWNEDGLAGICDDSQILCFALALHNGKDPFLKERIFGLTNPQANHGEDPKEYWYYLDSTPTHSWMRWRYMYPQAEFPYDELLTVNGSRSRTEPEYELMDTGAFDDNRYWEVTVDYAKDDPEDICIRILVRNAGPEAAELDVLPTLWFRNTWSWGIDYHKPEMWLEGGSIVARHRTFGTRRLTFADGGQALFCDNETNTRRLWQREPTAPLASGYFKDGINDHVVHGAASVNPENVGTKAAVRYHLRVEAGASTEIRLRLSHVANNLEDHYEAVMAARLAEADAFYTQLTPPHATNDEAMVMRQAFAGMLWTKQWYHYDIEPWMKGDPAGSPPPESRKTGRNAHWGHIDNADVISMPDKWEYPWYAVWDSAFHCIPLAHVDPQFAKDQLLLFLSERYQHPNGQIPAYEWNFGDVNPPVHAWACLNVFYIDGGQDLTFLARCFHKLLLNFTWWVNKKDRDGNNVFEGGFLGLDNIGPIDRSETVAGVHLEQSDGTAWMAFFALSMMRIALVLARDNHAYEDMASKFFEHFTYIASSINTQGGEHGLWNEEDGFYYDLLHREGLPSQSLPVRSMVGLIVLYAVTMLDDDELKHLSDFSNRRLWFMEDKVESLSSVKHMEVIGEGNERLLSIVGPDRLRRILERMLHPEEFLSDYGIRALSRAHRDNPVSVDLGNGNVATVGYEPAESSSAMFGGNSNWRGPIWFPVNYLLTVSLRQFHAFLGDDFTVEHPVGSGQHLTLDQVADDISQRLSAIFLRDAQGRRPVFGGNDRMQQDPAWRDLIPFYEYFHGDEGAGIGAPHQTGWTGLVADLLTTGRGCAASAPSALAPSRGVGNAEGTRPRKVLT